MDWSDLDWSTLDRLREGFLSGSAATGVYWKSRDDVATYDRTYGERIGWKWDQVLRELRLRSWRPASRNIVDWGCGSGIAAEHSNVSSYHSGRARTLRRRASDDDRLGAAHSRNPESGRAAAMSCQFF